MSALFSTPARRGRVLLASLLLIPGAVTAALVGCSDDDKVNPAAQDAATPDSATADTGAPQDGGSNPADAAAQVARGKYLVDHVAACGDCHTPRKQDGSPDMANYLAGADCFIDLNGPEDGGCALSTANLTNDATGLKTRTDAQIKTMFMDGTRPDGKFLASVMPYWVLHNMKAEDADAIVAYLRTVPAVAHTVQPAAAPFDNIPAPAAAIDPATIPATDAGASAEHGRYLAAMAGVCLECHTPELPFGSARPIDMSKPFAGNRGFPVGAPFPNTVYSANLTSHATGLQGWTASDIVKVLKQGKDRDGGTICPPMPVGPMGPFGGLTDEDALDIANYIVSLPPIDNAVTNGNGSCVSPF